MRRGPGGGSAGSTQDAIFFYANGLSRDIQVSSRNPFWFPSQEVDVAQVIQTANFRGEQMANRIVLGLIVLIAIVEAVLDVASGGVLPLLLVVLGLVYGSLAVDAEDATAFLAVAIAVGGAAHADVLSLEVLGPLGMALDGIVDQASTALFASVVTILGTRTLNRLKG